MPTAPRTRSYSGGELNPRARLGRTDCGVDHHLGASAVVQGDGARALFADGIDEFDGLIVAEGHQWIARAGVPRRAGPDVELTRNRQRLEARPANLAELEFVPTTRRETETGGAAVKFDAVGTAPAFVDAAGELGAFEHAGRAIGEFGQDGGPVVRVIGLAVANGREVLHVGHEARHPPDEVMGEIDPVTEHVAQFAGARELLLL